MRDFRGANAETRVDELSREISRQLPVREPVRQGGSSTSGIELSHGIIIEACNLGCSTYRVQRVHRYLKATCDSCGSGSGSGS